jgi:CheY-like chemotaxis protein
MGIKNPRIIIVEENQGIALLVRASLDLLGRRPRLIETHTGEDALDELQIGTSDLLITAQSLVGDINGPSLAIQAKHDNAALPVIVLGNEADPEPTDQEIMDAPFQYLRRPLIPELFIRVLRLALDGPESVPPEEAPMDLIGPVPQIDADRLRPICNKLMRDVQAMSYILADRNGKVLTYDGMAGFIDRDLLAAASGPAFAATMRMIPILGEKPRVLKYYDGDKFDIYSLAIGLHYFISLVFDGANGNRMLGSVARFGRVAADEMAALIGDGAFRVQASLAPEPTKVTPVHKEMEAKKRDYAAPAEPEAVRKKLRRSQEMAMVNQEQLPEVAPIVEPQLAPIEDFDPSILDSLDSLDMSQADALFDPERMADIAQKVNSGSRMSSADAEAQGIINWSQD